MPIAFMTLAAEESTFLSDEWLCTVLHQPLRGEKGLLGATVPSPPDPYPARRASPTVGVMRMHAGRVAPMIRVRKSSLIYAQPADPSRSLSGPSTFAARAALHAPKQTSVIAMTIGEVWGKPGRTMLR
jgi:hypothetical protein